MMCDLESLAQAVDGVVRCLAYRTYTSGSGHLVTSIAYPPSVPSVQQEGHRPNQVLTHLLIVAGAHPPHRSS